MPKITFKAPKQLKTSGQDAEPLSHDEDSYPNIYLPVNEDILEKVDVDTEVTITLKGRISGKEDTKNEYSDRKEIQIEVHSAEVNDADGKGYEDLDDTEE